MVLIFIVKEFYRTKSPSNSLILICSWREKNSVPATGHYTRLVFIVDASQKHHPQIRCLRLSDALLCAISVVSLRPVCGSNFPISARTSQSVYRSHKQSTSQAQRGVKLLLCSRPMQCYTILLLFYIHLHVITSQIECNLKLRDRRYH